MIRSGLQTIIFLLAQVGLEALHGETSLDKDIQIGVRPAALGKDLEGEATRNKRAILG